jgi:hypothetical protein
LVQENHDKDMQILLGNPDLASTSKIKSFNGTVETKPNIN